MSADDDLTDRSAGRYLTAITHFGGPRRHLEISGNRPFERLNVTMFPPPQPRRRVASRSVAIGPLTARSRNDWGCPDGDAAPLWKPAYTTVTHAVVHHTAGSNSLLDWEAEVRNIWYFHTFGNAWGDIGYNYLIDPNGVIYEGRAGGPGAIGAHFSCRNTNTVGVALLGTFTSGLPTAAALDSLKSLLAALCARNSIDPAAFAYHAPSALNVPTIIGHREGNGSSLTCTRTECPGNALYAMLPAIRSDVAALRLHMPTRKRSIRP
ncbi:MAG: peptidoglycan recognition family protein [Thermoanaerobaculia bacterium]